MSNRFLIVARVVDDGFDDETNYSLDFEVTVKPAAIAGEQVIRDWYCTLEVPENLVAVEGGNNDNDLYRYLQEQLLAELRAGFPDVVFEDDVDETDVLLQGVAGKGEKGEANGPEWQNEWRRAAPYAVNDVVVWEDRAWICTQDIASADVLEGWTNSPPETWPADWQDRFQNPPKLSRIDPPFHADLTKWVTSQGTPSTEDTGILNPNRRWDAYSTASVAFKGNWNKDKTYHEGNVVVRAKIRRKKKGGSAAMEEAKQTLQFIARRTTKGDDPLDYPADNDPFDDPWEIFLDTRTPETGMEWSKDSNGEDIQDDDDYWYYVNDIVTWQDATYICLVDHQFLRTDIYASDQDPGTEPDDRANPTSILRWGVVSEAPPKPRGKWKQDQRYRSGDVVWVDKSQSSDAEDQKLQFICVKPHRSNQNRKPAADKFDSERQPTDPDFPWLVYLDLADVVPDGGGGTSSDVTVAELFEKKPFLRPEKVPKQNGGVIVLNATAKKVGYDAASSEALRIELVFWPLDNGQDFPSDFYAQYIEWWLYAFEQKRADLNKATPVATYRLTSTSASGGTYDAGAVTVTIPLSTEPGSPTHRFGYNADGSVRDTTVLALAIKRVTSGDVLPKMTGKLDSATVTVVPAEVN